MNTAEKIVALKSLPIAKRNGIKVSELELMSENDINQLYDEKFPTPEADVVEKHVEPIQTSDTFQTEKGEIVPIVSASFERMTSNGAFVFATEGGIQIVTNDSDIRFLKMKGGLAVGDTIAFKPESIMFNAQMGMHTGVPNKSASPRLMSVVSYRTESKHVNLAMQAELTASGVSLSDAKSLVQDKIASDVLSTFKRPTFQL